MGYSDPDRAARVAKRASMPGEVVRKGQPKPALYTDLSIESRLAHMTSLCRAQWETAHGPISSVPRGDWPGEVFPLDSNRSGE